MVSNSHVDGRRIGHHDHCRSCAAAGSHSKAASRLFKQREAATPSLAEPAPDRPSITTTIEKPPGTDAAGRGPDDALHAGARFVGHSPRCIFPRVARQAPPRSCHSVPSRGPAENKPMAMPIRPPAVRRFKPARIILLELISREIVILSVAKNLVKNRNRDPPLRSG